jgi:hypothetical protein
MHSDNQKAVEMAFHLCGCSTKTVEAYLRCCWCQTQDLVNRRWREIEAVAAALLERETLTYDDVIETARPGSLALRGSLEAGMARKRAAVSSRTRTVKMNPHR